MIVRIKNNLKQIFRLFTILVSIIFSLLSGIQIFVDWDIVGIKNDKMKILVLIGILVACAFVSLVWCIFISNRTIIYAQDDIEIEVRYGDLMKYAFPKRKVTDRIIVIAVNRCFDMTVSDELIDPLSVHGKFLNKYIKKESDRIKLNEDIKNSLERYGYKGDKIKKRYGNQVRYPLGSVAKIEGDNGVTFFLLALTTFDYDCKAHCDKHEYVECFLKLFEYYDTHGQGKELFFYPMGTRMARTGLSRQESLEASVMLTKISKEHLKSKTTIIVDKRVKNEVAIKNLD